MGGGFSFLLARGLVLVARACIPAVASMFLLARLSSFVSCAQAGLVINEVLYDPEGTDDGLEFVELYNPTQEAISLKGFVLETGNGANEADWRAAIEWSTDIFVEPESYVLIGEAAVSPTPDFVALLDLQNGPDACRLRRGDVVTDLVGWGLHTFPEYYEGSPCEDVASGVSVGRLPDGADTQDNSSDFRSLLPPTPARRNLCLVDAGLVPGSMATVPALPLPFEPTEITVVVRNYGLKRLLPVECVVRFFSGGGAEREFLALLPVPVLEPGQSQPVSVSWQPTSEACLKLEADVVTEGDENPQNDTTSFTVRAGRGQVIVSEIMYAPVSGAPEWVELFNCSREPVDVRHWWMEDSSRKKFLITSNCRLIEPEAYLLLVQEEEGFRSSSPGACTGMFIEPEGGWPSLNNYNQPGEQFADVVCLRDSAGCISDYVAYSDEWCTRANSSIERVSKEASSRLAGNWCSSAAPSGSTPCQTNSVSEISQLLRGREINMSTQVISPDGDGYKDRVVFSFSLPAPGFRVDLAVFDVSGRLVKKLLDQKKVGLVGQAIWDGTDEGARRVPPAVYVVHLATFGPTGETRSSKTAIAVAPGRKR